MPQAEAMAWLQRMPMARPPTASSSNSAGGQFPLRLDPATETERWRAPATGGGGTMTTAGNLVFAASNAGDFEAFSADKGEKLWSVKLAPGFANPVSYMLDGKQYVSVLAGRAGKGRLYTFALDGSVPVPPPPAPAAARRPPAKPARLSAPRCAKKLARPGKAGAAEERAAAIARQM